jgi:hypothetical protein
MNTSLVKSSKAVKGSTSTVRHHLDAVDRAREIYLAQIKRAEADYFERITRAAEILKDATLDELDQLNQPDEPEHVTMPTPAPVPEAVG